MRHQNLRRESLRNSIYCGLIKSFYLELLNKINSCWFHSYGGLFTFIAIDFLHHKVLVTVSFIATLTLIIIRLHHALNGFIKTVHTRGFTNYTKIYLKDHLYPESTLL